MNSEKFVTWLSGFADLNMGKAPTKEQWELIVEHLAEVHDEPKPPVKMGSNIRDPNFGLFGDSGNTGAYAGLPPSSIGISRNVLSGFGNSSVTTLEARVNDVCSATHIGSIQSAVSS